MIACLPYDLAVSKKRDDAINIYYIVPLVMRLQGMIAKQGIRQ